MSNDEKVRDTRFSLIRIGTRETSALPVRIKPQKNRVMWPVKAVVC
jgi:hypothetical protein